MAVEAAAAAATAAAAAEAPGGGDIIGGLFEGVALGWGKPPENEDRRAKT